MLFGRDFSHIVFHPCFTLGAMSKIPLRKGLTSRPGFTLVELLVVIGIISVLIGILLPAMSRAREQAKVTTCLSQVRQLYLAYLSYAEENRGHIVSASTNGSLAWVDHTAEDPDTQIKNGQLYKFLKSNRVYKCPADTREEYAYSYAIVDPAGNNPNGGYTKLSQLRPASQQVVFLEDGDDRGSILGSFIMSLEPLGWIDAPGRLHRGGRYGGYTMVFADGHAQAHFFQDVRSIEIWSNYETRGQPDNKDLQFLASTYSPPRK